MAPPAAAMLAGTTVPGITSLFYAEPAFMFITTAAVLFFFVCFSVQNRYKLHGLLGKLIHLLLTCFIKTNGLSADRL